MKVKRFELKKAIEAGSDDFLDNEESKKIVVSFDGYSDEDVHNVLSRVSKVFAAVLLLPEIKIGANSIWTSDLGGDSMSYIDMVGKLNQEFKVEIPQELYGVLGTPNAFAKEILDLLSKNGRLGELGGASKGKKGKKRPGKAGKSKEK